MAVRLLLALMVFVFCLAEVSSDLKIDTGILHVGQLVVRGGNRRLMQDIDCGGLCKQRCSLHSRPNVCTRACGTCCKVQVCAAWDLREQRSMWNMLY